MVNRRFIRMLLAIVFALSFWGWLSLYRSEFLEPQHFPGQQDWLLTGDEPAYMMMALAIHRGEGINVRGAVESKAYEVFQSGSLPVRHDNDWTWSNYQARGMSFILDQSERWGNAQILWLPPFYSYWLSPLFSLEQPVRRANALIQAGLLTALATILFFLSLKAGPWTAATTGMALFSGLGGIPIGYYTTQAFPELLTLSCIVAGLVLYAREKRASDLAGDLLCLTALFLTPRSLIAVTLLFLFRIGYSFRSRHWSGLFILLSGSGLYVFSNLLIWGRILPPAAGGLISLLREKSQLADIGWIALGGVGAVTLLIWSVMYAAHTKHRRVVLPSVIAGWSLLAMVAGLGLAPELFSVLAQGVFMQFLSRDMGLLFSNPLSFASLLGCGWLLLRKWDRTALYGLLLFLGYLAVNASFPDYRAGRCPMGRYQVLLNGILIAGLVRALLLYGQGPPAAWLTGPVWLLGCFSLVIAGFLTTHPNFWYRDYHPLFAFKLIQRHYDWLPQWGRPHVIGLSLAWLTLYSLTLLIPVAVTRWVRGRVTVKHLR
ncbi:MAG: hypothetical protein KDL31_03900 [Kiritimatiellae bacterium]|nr:hypothetical protein [Kiritimatiellia bacterium]